MFWKKKRPPFIKHSISRKMNILYSVVLLGVLPPAGWPTISFWSVIMSPIKRRS